VLNFSNGGNKRLIVSISIMKNVEKNGRLLLGSTESTSPYMFGIGGLPYLCSTKN